MKFDANRTLALLIAVYPVLNIYGIGIRGFSIGKVLILLVVLAGIIKGIYRKVSLPKGYLTYFLYMMTVPQLLALGLGEASFPDLAYKSTGTVLFAVMLGYCARYLKLNDLLEFYRKTAIVCCVYFLMQEFALHVLDYKLYGIVPGTVLASTGRSISSYIRLQASMDRSCSLFLEPAHFAQYLSIYLYIILFSQKDRFASRSVVFVSLVLLLIRSGNGYIALTVAWAIWICICLHRRLYVRSALASLAAILITVPIAVNISYGPSGHARLRVEELFSGKEPANKGNTSGYIRIYRGYVLYGELPPLNKTFGIGQGNLETYMESHPEYQFAVLTSSQIKDKYYLNGIQQNLVFGGVFGLLFYLLFMAGLIKNNTLPGQMLVVLALLSGAMASSYNGTNLLTVLIFSSLFKREAGQGKDISH